MHEHIGRMHSRQMRTISSSAGMSKRGKMWGRGVGAGRGIYLLYEVIFNGPGEAEL